MPEMMTGEIDIAANLAETRRRIAAACGRAGRNVSEVTLIGVSKTRSIDEIARAHRAGLADLGENRVEEVEAKIPQLREMLADSPPNWHMIGHVQSRKARGAALLCDVVHSVDSLRLATRLNRFAEEAGRRLPVLVELNISGEDAKYGYPAHDDAQVERLLDDLGRLSGLQSLEVRGLMTVAPIVDDAEAVRPVFRRMVLVRDWLRSRLDYSEWSVLSMGMTDDFEVAIEEGATMVRIGRAIFGPRTY